MEAAARAVTFPAYAEGWTVAPTQGASGFPLLAQPPALPLQADCDNNAKSNTTRRAIAPFAKVTQCCTSLPTHLIRRSGKIPTLTQRKNETEERGGGGVDMGGKRNPTSMAAYHFILYSLWSLN